MGLHYFTDPVLRASTLGCMLMCMGAGMVGVLVFLRKQSLLGESLSHAAYPGVVLGGLSAYTLGGGYDNDFIFSIGILGGAFVTSWMGLGFINGMQKRLRVHPDAALCFVLSAFFGIGVTLASRLQFTHTSLYLKIQAYLYGQSATMTDIHIVLYGVLAVIISVTIFFLYKELQIMTFDRDFAKSLGLYTRWIDGAVCFLITFSLVIGIRSVGVVLMSAMFIAPAVAARQYTHQLSLLFILAGFFGLISGFLGNVLSLELSQAFSTEEQRLSLPTGPMVVLVASFLCIISLLFAPERGLISRFFRILSFRYRCLMENILKTIWHLNIEGGVTFRQISGFQALSPLYLRFIMKRLAKGGWVRYTDKRKYILTREGRQRAVKIVRLHRLWEVYLADYLGMGMERVHHSADEMEHILTPELEERLTQCVSVFVSKRSDDARHLF